MTHNDLHWLWLELGRNRRIFGFNISKFYDSGDIQGYIHNGNPLGLWIFRNAQTNTVIEEKIFIQ